MHRYRFKHALDDVNLHDEKYNDALMHEAYAKVCRSIEGHKRAVELVSLCILRNEEWTSRAYYMFYTFFCHVRYVEKIDACYVRYFFLLLGLVIVAFTSTFVRVSQCANKN